jgi:hypothetical protein
VRAWAAAWLRNHCDRCTDLAATVGVGHIEATSGPRVRDPLVQGVHRPYLARARAAAERDGVGYVPALPRMSPT